MHFRKKDFKITGLVALLLFCFSLIFLGNAAVTVLGGEGGGSEFDYSSPLPPESNTVSPEDPPVSSSSASEYAEVFASGYDIREVKSCCPVTLPDGFGGVLEETRTASRDFVTADALAAVTDKSMSGAELNLDKIMAAFPVSRGENQTVVIYHTHTSEGYAKSVSQYYDLSEGNIAQKEEQSVVAVGKALATALEARGFRVIHITESFDMPSRSGSFKRSAAALEKALKGTESPALVIDLHRGSVLQSSGDKIKPTVYANGRKAAQLRLIAPFDGDGSLGCASWEEKLSLALHLNRELNKISPLLSLPVSLENQKYNLYLPYPCIMAEIGTDVNTADEATLSALLLADAIAEMLLN